MTDDAMKVTRDVLERELRRIDRLIAEAMDENNLQRMVELRNRRRRVDAALEQARDICRVYRDLRLQRESASAK